MNHLKHCCSRATLTLAIALTCSTALADGPYLSSKPTPLGFADCPPQYASRCQALHRTELQGYQLARSGRISWSEMVNRFYELRDQILPLEDDMTREMESYQRYLAKKIDARAMHETEWAYLLDKKVAELNARNEMLNATRQRNQAPAEHMHRPSPNYTCMQNGPFTNCTPF